MYILNVFLNSTGMYKNLRLAKISFLSVVSLYYLFLIGTPLYSETTKNSSMLNSMEEYLSEDNNEEEGNISWDIIEASHFTDNILKIRVKLESKKDYSIFKESLSFKIEFGIDAFKVIYPPSFKRVDPISSKEKDSFRQGEFEAYFIPIALSEDSNISVFIKYSACTYGRCLFPHTVEIKTKFKKESTVSGISDKEIEEQNNVITPVTTDDTDVNEYGEYSEYNENTSISYNPHLILKKFISFESSNLLLFILIFLAGLLTNLTPCVAPMIPITIGILSKEKNKRSPIFYGLGIMVSYLCLGMISTLGGKMFGFVMGSIWINVIFAVFMLFLGISMLEGASFSKLQGVASNVIEKFSKLKSENSSSNSLVFVKGSMAGLLAAPCTGPILAALITYIATSQKMIYGLSLMLFYSLGFSLPYIILGSFSKKVMNIKIKPSILGIVKIIFSGIMFGLCFYYLKNVFYRYLNVNIWIYSIAISFVLMIGIYTVLRWKNKFNLFWNLILSFLIGWGLFSTYQQINFVYESDIEWISSSEEAFMQSDLENKDILLDNWANWCESCLTIDKYFHQNKDKLSNFILWKKDLSRETQENIEHRKKYKIKGLPVIIIIPKNKDVNNLKYIYDSYELDSYLNKIKE